MTPTQHGRFADPATEARFQRTARTLRLPFVRLYGVLFMLVTLAYSIVDPFYVEPAENARLAVYLGFTLLAAGAYVGATFHERYVEQPLVDCLALLVLSLLVGKVNYVLFDHLIHLHAALHAVGVINRLAVTAFAAVTLAGRPRLFALWLALDFTGWMAIVMPG